MFAFVCAVPRTQTDARLYNDNHSEPRHGVASRSEPSTVLTAADAARRLLERYYHEPASSSRPLSGVGGSIPTYDTSTVSSNHHRYSTPAMSTFSFPMDTPGPSGTGRTSMTHPFPQTEGGSLGTGSHDITPYVSEGSYHGPQATPQFRHPPPVDMIQPMIPSRSPSG